MTNALIMYELSWRDGSYREHVITHGYYYSKEADRQSLAPRMV